MGVDEVAKEGLRSFYIHQFDPEEPYKIVKSRNIQTANEPTPSRPFVSSSQHLMYITNH